MSIDLDVCGKCGAALSFEPYREWSEWHGKARRAGPRAFCPRKRWWRHKGHTDYINRLYPLTNQNENE